ncbi:MAG TPA: hypothetical protein VKA70_22025 [Blastocatellia bacterium]|nr:hypothetical protein [Blastocatellia bacterium]
MADDKIERQIAFIVEQQAKNTVNIVRWQEGMTDLRDALLSLINIVDRHEQQIAILVEDSKEAKAEFKEIRALFKEVALRFEKSDERMSKTDERLNALIALMEKRE